MADADIYRPHVCAGAYGRPDLSTNVGIKHWYLRAALSAKLVEIATPINQLFSDADRRHVQRDAKERGQAAAPWMGNAVAIPQHKIRPPLEFVESSDDRRPRLKGS